MEKITGYPIEKKQLRAKRVTVDGLKKVIDDCYNRYRESWMRKLDKYGYEYKISDIAWRISEEADSNVFIDNGTRFDSVKDVVGDSWDEDTVFNDGSCAWTKKLEKGKRGDMYNGMCKEDWQITGWKMVKGTAIALIGMVADCGACNSYIILYVGEKDSLHFYIPVNGNTYFHEYGLANTSVDIASGIYEKEYPDDDDYENYSDDFRNAVMPPPNMGAMLSEFADQLIVMDSDANIGRISPCVNAKRGVTRSDWKHWFATNYPHEFNEEYWDNMVEDILYKNGLEEITNHVDDYCFGLDAKVEYTDGFLDINGTVVFCMIVADDEETDVAMCFYFDQNGKIQVYYPEDGNTFDKERRVAYNVHELDEFDDKRFADYDSETLDYEYASSVWNPKAMLDDIKQHIVTE